MEISSNMATDLKSKLNARIVRWQELFNKRVMKGVEDIYIEDYTCVPRGVKAVYKRKAFVEQMKKLIEITRDFHHLEVTSVNDLFNGEDIAVQQGISVLCNKKGDAVSYIKFMLVWKRFEDGEWYICLDIDNENKP